MAVQAPDSPPAHAIPSQTCEGLSPPPGPSAIHAHPSEAPQIPVEDLALRQDPDLRDTQDDSPVTTPDIDALIASHQHLSPGVSCNSWLYTNNSCDQPWFNGPLAGLSEFPCNTQSHRNNSFYPPWSIDPSVGSSELPYNTRSHTNNCIEQSWSNGSLTTSIELALPVTQPRRRKRALSSSPPIRSSIKVCQPSLAPHFIADVIHLSVGRA